MKTNKKVSFINFIIGILVITAFIYAILFLLNVSLIYIGDLISKLSMIASKLDVVVIVALITGSVSIISVVISSIISKIIEYKQNIKRYLYTKKEEPYSEFIKMVYKIQEKTIAEENYSESEMIEDIYNFSKKLTLWGSNKVIRKWLDFRSKTLEHEMDHKETLLMLEEIIFEIRKDMGQSKKGLKKGDILRFFINDVNESILNDMK